MIFRVFSDSVFWNINSRLMKGASIFEIVNSPKLMLRLTINDLDNIIHQSTWYYFDFKYKKPFLMICQGWKIVIDKQGLDVILWWKNHLFSYNLIILKLSRLPSLHCTNFSWKYQLLITNIEKWIVLTWNISFYFVRSASSKS